MDEAGFRTLTTDWAGTCHAVKWDDDLVASVAGKMYALYCLRGVHAGKLSFKVPDESFLPLTEQPGIIPAPYAARYKWIAVIEPQRHGDAWLRQMIHQSYTLVAARLPRKIRRELGLAP